MQFLYYTRIADFTDLMLALPGTPALLSNTLPYQDLHTARDGRAQLDRNHLLFFKSGTLLLMQRRLQSIPNTVAEYCFSFRSPADDFSFC